MRNKEEFKQAIYGLISYDTSPENRQFCEELADITDNLYQVSDDIHYLKSEIVETGTLRREYSDMNRYEYFLGERQFHNGDRIEFLVPQDSDSSSKEPEWKLGRLRYYDRGTCDDRRLEYYGIAKDDYGGIIARRLFQYPLDGLTVRIRKSDYD